MTASVSTSRLRGALPPVRAASARAVLLVGLVATLALFVVILLTATANNQRVHRLQTSGIATTITITSCTGNLGGSGSNAAGFTCRGRYSVSGSFFTAVVNGQTTFVPTGQAVAATADPQNPTYVVLTALVPTLRTNFPLLALIAAGGATVGFAILIRRTKSRTPRA